MDEKDALPGHEHLTMHDQLRAMSMRSKLETSPITGAVQNRRREFMRNQIQFRATQAANRMKRGAVVA